METKNLGNALIPQSSFDSIFGPNTVGRYDFVLDTEVPTVFRDTTISPAASYGWSSWSNPDQIIRIGTMLMVKIKSLQRLR
jgi:hypothetical protein